MAVSRQQRRSPLGAKIPSGGLQHVTVCTGRILFSDSLKIGLVMYMVPVVLGIHIIHGMESAVFDFEDTFPCVHGLLHVS